MLPEKPFLSNLSIGGANHSDTTGETSAAAIFREFDPQAISNIYAELIKNTKRDTLEVQDMSISGFAARQVRARYPDMYRLKKIIELPYEEGVISFYEDKVKQLVNHPDVTLQELQTIFQPLLNMSSNNLQQLLMLAFTPASQRNGFIFFGDLTSSDVESRVRDLSGIATAEDRLSSFTEMCDTSAQASEDTFYAAIIDRENRGKLNAFKHNPRKTKSTRLGKCPAAPYVRRHIEALRLTSIQNRDRILELIA